MAKQNTFRVTVFPTNAEQAKQRGDYVDDNCRGRKYIEFGKEIELTEGELNILKDSVEIIDTKLRHREGGLPPVIEDVTMPRFSIQYADKAEKRTQAENERLEKDNTALRTKLAIAQGRKVDVKPEDADGEVKIDNDDPE